MTRLAVVLLAVLTLAPAARALSIRPSTPRVQPTPDGRHVLVFSGSYFLHPTDPDAEAILARNLAPGLYRRGEWAAPVWPFPRETSGLDRLWPADDGVHLVAVPFHSALGDLFSVRPFKPEDYAAFRGQPAFHVFAGGRLAHTVPVSAVARDPDRLKDDGGRWLDELAIDDGVVRVTALDGNRTAFALATGERVEGVGAAAPRTAAWPAWAPAALFVAGVAGVVGASRLRRAFAREGGSPQPPSGPTLPADQSI